MTALKKNPNDIKSIMILRPEGSMGDCVLSSFIFREIKNKYPHIKICAATFGVAYEYYKRNKYIDYLYKLPIKSKIRSSQRWLELIWAGLVIRTKGIDIIIDSSDKSSPNWLLFKYLSSKKNGLLDKDHFVSNLYNRDDLHGVEQEQQILETIGIKGLDTIYDIYSTPEAENKLSDFLKKNNIDEYICLNCHASTEPRSFNSNTVHIIDKNMPDNKKIIIPCMPRHINSIKSYIPEGSKHSYYIYETNDIFELISLIKSSKLLITPDTAAVHIGCGLHKPTIVFYITTHPHHAPRNDLAKVIISDSSNVNIFNEEDYIAALKYLLEK